MSYYSSIHAFRWRICKNYTPREPLFMYRAWTRTSIQHYNGLWSQQRYSRNMTSSIVIGIYENMYWNIQSVKPVLSINLSRSNYEQDLFLQQKTLHKFLLGQMPSCYPIQLVIRDIFWENFAHDFFSNFILKISNRVLHWD